MLETGSDSRLPASLGSLVAYLEDARPRLTLPPRVAEACPSPSPRVSTNDLQGDERLALNDVFSRHDRTSDRRLATMEARSKLRDQQRCRGPPAGSGHQHEFAAGPVEPLEAGAEIGEADTTGAGRGPSVVDSQAVVGDPTIAFSTRGCSTNAGTSLEGSTSTCQPTWRRSENRTCSISTYSFVSSISCAS